MGRRAAILFLAFSLIFSLLGCGADRTSVSSSAQSNALRDHTPVVLLPAADGTAVYRSDCGELDASHTDQGYVMVRYTGSCDQVRLQILTPTQETYTYYLSGDGQWETFPLTCGDGTYTVRILENVEADSYAISQTQELNVALADEFLPFLYPNQYVNFTPDSQAVAMGENLAIGTTSDLDVVTSIYHFVTQTITYDTEKAQSVSYGYIPDVDATLADKTGICFDYAALMTAMLRSQRIPTRLEVGYSGQIYHAWISTYVDDMGWIDNIIQFDGESWQLLDPTLAAANSTDAVGKYVGDGTNYTRKFTY
jgi:transglutaminase-like putative cysteine protease